MYFVTFIDNRSRYTKKVTSKKIKLILFSKFKQYEIEVKNQTRKKITMLRSDNGGEYKSNEFNLFVKIMVFNANSPHPIPLNKMEFVRGRIGH
jgi:hypothetical protein